MKLCVDSSALAKRYVYEDGSEILESFLTQADELGFSVILIPEIISGLNRRLRENRINSKNYYEVKKQLLNDAKDSIILNITPQVVKKSLILLEKNPLRAMDALHIACALEWGADLFLTADKRQFRAAQNSGLKTEFIGKNNLSS